jgi:putative sigma-54 modulation protein
MRTHYTARQGHLTPEIKAYCEARIADLDPMLEPSAEADIILSREKNREKAEIHVMARGAGLVVIEESADMLVSLGLAFDALERKIKKEREKFREKKRRGGRERKDLALPSEPAEAGPRIARVDYFSSKPMSLGEALVQIEAKKKEVFVFRMEPAEKWTVLFRRKNGSFGLVRPE